LEQNMHFPHVLRNGVWMIALGLCAQVPQPPTPPPPAQPPGKDAPNTEAKGMVPRGAPSNYQAQAQVGKVTIGAEFMRHAIPTAQNALTTEDYVVVEAGFFGPAGEKAKLSVGDFSLRINGKKSLPGVPYGMALESTKDPDWVPPELPSEKKGGSGISTGGGGGGADSAPPLPPKMPLPLQRAMHLKVQKAALPEGERTLPVAGLLFFLYRGQSKSIKSVELTYAGPAGKATLTLQP
jgi:hypothetical protein